MGHSTQNIPCKIIWQQISHYYDMTLVNICDRKVSLIGCKLLPYFIKFLTRKCKTYASFAYIIISFSENPYQRGRCACRLQKQQFW